MKVQATSHIRHDGNDFHKGDMLELEDHQGHQLINAGVAQLVLELADHPAIVTDENGDQGIDPSKLTRKELESFAVENGLMDEPTATAFATKPELLEAVQAALEAKEPQA